MGILQGCAATIGFCTVFPAGRAAPFDAFARHNYLMPLAGYLLGGIAALITLFLPVQEIAAALALVLVMLLSGYHHLDGLLDLGDGLMVHTSREKRIKALTDSQIGAGALGLGLSVILLNFSGLLAAASVPVMILVAEVLAKWTMCCLLTLGRPFKEGSFSYTRSFSKWWFPLLSLVLCLPLLLLPHGFSLLIAGIIACLFVLLLLTTIGNRLFGGINGDFVGAANEITRAAVLIAGALVLML